jgi:oligoribonuclease NrnB/cAMP/cGMP phosphodiesterase (DHH superfamily)
MAKNITVVCHADLDGAACAVLLSHWHQYAWSKDKNDKLVFVPASYNSIDQIITDYLKTPVCADNDELWVLDITPSAETLELMNKAKVKVTLVDHHNKKKKVLSKYGWAYFDKDRCGATALMDFLTKNFRSSIPYPGTLQAFLNCVEAWDIWLLGSPHRERGESLNRLYWFLEFDLFVSEFSPMPSEDPEMTESQNAERLTADMLKFAFIGQILHYKEVRYTEHVLMKQLYEPNRYIDGNGNKFAVIFAEKNTAKLGNEALNTEFGEDLDYVVVVHANANRVSMYSRGHGENMDVSKIAEALGGGGHPGAAGFITAITKPLEYQISDMLNKLELED